MSFAMQLTQEIIDYLMDEGVSTRPGWNHRQVVVEKIEDAIEALLAQEADEASLRTDTESDP